MQCMYARGNQVPGQVAYRGAAADAAPAPNYELHTAQHHAAKLSPPAELSAAELPAAERTRRRKLSAAQLLRRRGMTGRRS